MTPSVIKALRLGPKFTLLLLLVFIIGSAIGGFVLSHVLLKRAQAQVVSEGLMLMETIDAVRDYTNAELRGVIETSLDTNEFVPHTVPSYSSRRVFETLRDNADYKDVLYKEAMFNPTNVSDRADPFEEDLIRYFQNHPDIKERSDFQHLPVRGDVFFSARPIVINEQSCLECHGVPEDAPPAMIAQYGSENGFGWQVGSIAGAQVIYVPSADVFQAARQSSVTVMGVFLGIFSVAVLAINALLKPTVIQPVQYLARVSQRLSQADGEDGDDPHIYEEQLKAVATRKDELGQLARIFRRMVQDVINRERQLREQVKALRIEIDQARRAKEVAQITESDYFQDLQKKAKAFQRRNRKPSVENDALDASADAETVPPENLGTPETDIHSASSDSDPLRAD